MKDRMLDRGQVEGDDRIKNVRDLQDEVKKNESVTDGAANGGGASPEEITHRSLLRGGNGSGRRLSPPWSWYGGLPGCDRRRFEETSPATKDPPSHSGDSDSSICKVSGQLFCYLETCRGHENCTDDN